MLLLARLPLLPSLVGAAATGWMEDFFPPLAPPKPPPAAYRSLLEHASQALVNRSTVTAFVHLPGAAIAPDRRPLHVQLSLAVDDERRLSLNDGQALVPLLRDGRPETVIRETAMVEAELVHLPHRPAVVVLPGTLPDVHSFDPWGAACPGGPDESLSLKQSVPIEVDVLHFTVPAVEEAQWGQAMHWTLLGLRIPGSVDEVHLATLGVSSHDDSALSCIFSWPRSTASLRSATESAKPAQAVDSDDAKAPTCQLDADEAAQTSGPRLQLQPQDELENEGRGAVTDGSVEAPRLREEDLHAALHQHALDKSREARARSKADVKCSRHPLKCLKLKLKLKTLKTSMKSRAKEWRFGFKNAARGLALDFINLVRSSFGLEPFSLKPDSRSPVDRLPGPGMNCRDRERAAWIHAQAERALGGCKAARKALWGRLAAYRSDDVDVEMIRKKLETYEAAMRARSRRAGLCLRKILRLAFWAIAACGATLVVAMVIKGWKDERTEGRIRLDMEEARPHEKEQ